MKLPKLPPPQGLPPAFSANVPRAPQLRPCRSGASARLILASFAAFLAFSLTGCVRTHTVDRTVVAQGVLNATLDQLLTQLAKQDAAIQTLNASVDITASSGGEHEGQVKETPSFAGYIFMRRPEDLRVLMLLPVIRSRALDMVSDGKQFKLLIPPKNKAVEGADQFSSSSKNGLENLRPYIVRDALLIPTAAPNEFVSLTKDKRILPRQSGHKELVEEPDYDITILRTKEDHVLETVRVIHFGRTTLQPYQQDIYDHDGRIVTTVQYDNYHKYGDIVFPTSILVSRPIDEYKLKIEMTKLVFNQKMDDEQFLLKIPEGIPIQKM